MSFTEEGKGIVFRVYAAVAMILAGVGFLLAAAFTATASSTAPTQTLRVVLAIDVDYVDPALAYAISSWNMEYATCAKLLNYPDKPAPAGSRLVAEVAGGFPRVSRNGRTYTFTVSPASASATDLGSLRVASPPPSTASSSRG